MWIRALGPGKQQALDRFAAIAGFLKPMQFIYFILWWSGMLLPSWDMDAVFIVCAILGLGLMVAGQVFQCVLARTVKCLIFNTVLVACIDEYLSAFACMMSGRK